MMEIMNPLLEKFIKLYGYRPTEFDKKYLELLEMGRFRILDVPDVQPGSCCNCGASRNDGRKYLDTGRHVEWFGAVFFCGLCLREYAEAMGLFEHVQKEVDDLKLQIMSQDALTAKQEQLEAIVLKTFEEVKAIYVDVHPDSDEYFPDTDISMEPEPPITDEPATSKTKSRATKSTASSGRSNVRSLTDILGSNPS